MCLYKTVRPRKTCCFNLLLPDSYRNYVYAYSLITYLLIRILAFRMHKAKAKLNFVIYLLLICCDLISSMQKLRFAPIFSFLKCGKVSELVSVVNLFVTAYFPNNATKVNKSLATPQTHPRQTIS